MPTLNASNASTNLGTAVAALARNRGPTGCTLTCTNVQAGSIQLRAGEVYPLECSTGLGTVSLTVPSASGTSVDVDVVKAT